MAWFSSARGCAEAIIYHCKATGIAVMSNFRFESWSLNEQTAKVLGLPAVALTPTAQLAASG
jgi:hypothetical protein